MPPQQITDNEQRLDRLLSDLHGAVDEADDTLQHVFSSHLVLAGSGHVEQSVRQILSEYACCKGNPKIGRFVEEAVAWQNALNCEKIQRITKRFDDEWWNKVKKKTSQEQRNAVNSLKKHRDKVAHGEPIEIGFSDVEDYCKKSKSFVRAFSAVVLGD